mgnify:CR=1 FL=1
MLVHASTESLICKAGAQGTLQEALWALECQTWGAQATVLQTQK